MSSVDNFVRDSILSYPVLMPNRTAVLHHVFCVLGNGYKWSNEGTVVSDCPDEQKKHWNKDDELIRIEEELKQVGPSIRPYLRKGMMEDYQLELEVIENIEQRIKDTPPIVDIYPQHEYSLLLNIPENVTADWKAAADEARELAIAAGWVLPV